MTKFKVGDEVRTPEGTKGTVFYIFQTEAFKGEMNVTLPGGNLKNFNEDELEPWTEEPPALTALEELEGILSSLEELPGKGEGMVGYIGGLGFAIKFIRAREKK